MRPASEANRSEVILVSGDVYRKKLTLVGIVLYDHAEAGNATSVQLELVAEFSRAPGVFEIVDAFASEGTR